MFTSEQHIAKNPQKTIKKGLFNVGTSLERGMAVKPRITYKEITLIFGILVALLVSLTFWVSGDAEVSSNNASPELLQSWKTISVNLIRTAYTILF